MSTIQFRDDAILPGVRLGVIVLDTCDNPLYTAEQSLDLLQGFMYRKVKNIHKDVVCTKDSIKNILGIIGAQTSEVDMNFREFLCLILISKSEGFSGDRPSGPYFSRASGQLPLYCGGAKQQGALSLLLQNCSE